MKNIPIGANPFMSCFGEFIERLDPVRNQEEDEDDDGFDWDSYNDEVWLEAHRDEDTKDK